MDKIQKTQQQWREQLDEETYRICRQGGTEAAFSGKYWDNKQQGDYHCACCGEHLFTSLTKYDSGSGWPSFHTSSNTQCITEHVDNSHGMRRVEAVCSKCDSHLGHIFPDGPVESGLRYCMNSASLQFKDNSDK